MRLLVLADTHVRNDRTRTLPDVVWEQAREADAVLHAGDVLTAELLDRLRTFGPVYAVLGNNDVQLRSQLPETLTLDLAGVAVAMIHDAGSRKGRAARL